MEPATVGGRIAKPAIVELIAATTTKAGLTVRCVLDQNNYPKGVKVSDKLLAALNLKKDAFHPNGITPYDQAKTVPSH